MIFLAKVDILRNLNCIQIKVFSLKLMNKQTKSRNFSYKYEKSRFNPLGKDFISEYELWHCSPDPTTNFEFRLTNFAKDQNDYCLFICCWFLHHLVKILVKIRKKKNRHLLTDPDHFSFFKFQELVLFSTFHLIICKNLLREIK